MQLDDSADKVAQLLEQKLGIRGAGLEAKVTRAGRRLPRHLREEAEYMMLALRMQANPRLARQIDWPRLERGAQELERYLKGIDAWDRRRGLLVSWLAGNALNLLIVAALVAAVLAWRGFM